MNNKRIGFVDNNLENYHANVYLSAIRKELVGRGFTVAGCYGLQEEAGRQWAEKNGVPYFASAVALNKAVDAYMVLAPSNPVTHLELCRKVFRFGKPTYVDKTFAPDLKTAKKIFALADRFKTPVQTTSALRYTNAQACAREMGMDRIRHMVSWGPGGSYEEYAIHPLELVISCMGPKVERILRRGDGDQRQLIIDFSGGRTAVVNVYAKTETPYAASFTTDKGTRIMTVDCSRLFVDTAAAILDFLESGQPNIDRAESLAIRSILDAAMKPKAQKKFIVL